MYANVNIMGNFYLNQLQSEFSQVFTKKACIVLQS